VVVTDNPNYIINTLTPIESIAAVKKI